MNEGVKNKLRMSKGKLELEVYDFYNNVHIHIPDIQI